MKTFSDTSAVAPATTTSRGTTIVQGQPLSGGLAGGRVLPKLQAEPDFWFYVHPRDWSVVTIDGKLYWAPEIRKIPIVPVNGIKQTENGLDHALFRAKFSDLGFIQVPSTPPYKRRVEVHGSKPDKPRYTYLDMWTRVEMYSDGSCETTRNEDAFNRFRVGLVERGVIDPIRPSVIARLKRIVGKRITRHIDEVHIPSRKAIVDKAEEKLGELDEARTPQPTQHASPDLAAAKALAEAERLRAQAEADRQEVARLKAELQLLRASQGEEFDEPDDEPDEGEPEDG